MATSPHLERHEPARRRKRLAACARLLLFWTRFVLETAGRRRLAPLVRCRLGKAWPPEIQGAAHLPARGSFVLAANHYGGRGALDIIAAVLASATLARPELANRYLLITGWRDRPIETLPLPARCTRRLVGFAYRRWAAHTLRLPLGDTRASIVRLREWRRRVRHQPALVFPEGRTRLAFGAIRPGAGRWLATLPAPTIPVGVWWEGERPVVRIGAPLQWAARPELRDAQLGLAIANLLPPELAPAWASPLARWRSTWAARGIMPR